MTYRVAINGLGRIGRLVLRQLYFQREIELVAINDLFPIENLAYLIKYDTVHRQFPDIIGFDNNRLLVGDKTIPCFAEKDPSNLPWKELKVDLVIESTGHFTQKEDAEKHIQAGAKRVLITAPSGPDVPTFVMGVNEKSYIPDRDVIISNASCTTNCIAPLMKVMLENFGIEEGLMTTIHAVTASQPSVDSPSKRDFRAGRSSFQNVIPASTGAAKAVALCLPELKGKLTGMAFRVPVIDVSCVDVTLRLTRGASYEEICFAMRKAEQTDLKGILKYCDEMVVSSDFIGSPFSAIFDADAGVWLNDRFCKLIAWYDNEMGYSLRVADLVLYVMKHEVRK